MTKFKKIKDLWKTLSEKRQRKRFEKRWKPVKGETLLKSLNAENKGYAGGGSTYEVKKWEAQLKKTKTPFTATLWVRGTTPKEAERIVGIFKDLKNAGLSVPHLVSIEKNEDPNYGKDTLVVVSDITKPDSKVLDLAMGVKKSTTPEIENMGKKDAERLGEYLAKFHNAGYVTHPNHNTPSGHLFLIHTSKGLEPKAVDVENAIKETDMDDTNLGWQVYELHDALSQDLQAPFEEQKKKTRRRIWALLERT